MESNQHLHSFKTTQKAGDTPLPIEYVLGPNDVLCGKKCFKHVGNQNFRKLIEATLNHYTTVPSKMERSCIIQEIVDSVRANSLGGFVRHDPIMNRFFQVSEKAARDKTSQAFRDALIGMEKATSRAKLRQDVRNRSAIVVRNFSFQQHSLESSTTSSVGNATQYENPQGMITSAVCGSRMVQTLGRNFVPITRTDADHNQLQPRVVSDPFDLCEIHIGKHFEETLENNKFCNNIVESSTSAKFSLTSGTLAIEVRESDTKSIVDQSLKDHVDMKYSMGYCSLSGPQYKDSCKASVGSYTFPTDSQAWAASDRNQELDQSWDLLISRAEQDINANSNPFEPIPISEYSSW